MASVKGSFLAQFPKTKDGLEKIFKMLQCVKCSQVPTDQVFMLGGCDHKYCDNCLDKFAGKPCYVCKKSCSPKEAGPDLFTSHFLQAIKKVETTLEEEIQETKDKVPEPEEAKISAAAIPAKIATKKEETVTKSTPRPKRERKAKAIVEEDSPQSETSEGKESEKVSSKKGKTATRTAPKRKKKSEEEIPQVKQESGKSSAKEKEKENVSVNIALKRDRKRKSTLDKNIQNSKQTDDEDEKLPSEASNEEPKPIASATRTAPKRERKTSPEITDLANTSTPIKSKGLKRKRNRSSASGSSCSSSLSSVQKISPTNITNSPSWANTSFSSNCAVDKKNSKGETQLHVACRSGQLEKMKQLVDLGADLNAQDFAGWTPLHEAIMGKGKNKLDLVVYLCKQKCNTNLPGSDNEFALHEAARAGLQDIVKCLLSHSASPNVRNGKGKLPRDVAENDAIKQLLDNAAGVEFDGNDRLNASMSDDPVVLQLQFAKAVMFFSCKLSVTDMSAIKGMNLQVSKTLRGEVTHIIFDIPEEERGEEKSNRGKEISFSSEFLHGIVHGNWMLYKEWIDKCIYKKKLLSPKDYEVQGCFSLKDAPTKARLNKEVGNPGLLNGFTFYLYKSCSYEGFTKQQLSKLIIAAEGRVVNREPNPDSVDPLESPIRFHAKEDNHKLVLTSHVILYGDKDVPSQDKKLNMEHIKTLHVKWLIESIGNFSLLNPDLYL